MKDTELKAVRDRDLFVSYQKALREHDFPNQWEAVEYVRTHPAPRFYISSKVCSLLLGRLFAGKSLQGLQGLAKKRLLKLSNMYKAFAGGDFGRKGMSRERICEMLIEMPAPEFYITHRYATRIITKEIARHNQEKIRRLIG